MLLVLELIIHNLKQGHEDLSQFFSKNLIILSSKFVEFATKHKKIYKSSIY